MSSPSAYRRQRFRWLVAGGVGLAILVGIPIFIVPWNMSIAAALEEHGFVEVEVERTEMFTFTFTGKKDGDDCWGSVTKSPGVLRIGQVCIAPKR